MPIEGTRKPSIYYSPVIRGLEGSGSGGDPGSSKLLSEFEFWLDVRLLRKVPILVILYVNISSDIT